MEALIRLCKWVPGNLGNKKVIWVQLENSQQHIRELKAIQAKWNPHINCWYLPDNNHFRALVNLPLKDPVGDVVLAKIGAGNLVQFNKMKEHIILKAYSKSTLRTYLLEFAQFLYLLKNTPVNEISPDQLRAYFLYCHHTLKMGESHLHSRINALKFYYEQVLGQDQIFAEIPRPKKPSQLPKVLDQKEIKALFMNCNNLKHRTMLQLCYGMGLRVSEVVGLKIDHIDSKRMQVLIQCAKGKKDRYVNLPEAVLTDLREYYKEFRPNLWLFEGQYGAQYSIRSVQQVFKQAMTKARIKKKVGIHSLRHSYATHLHEFGTDISFIQKLLGHNNISTTLIYTQVSRSDIGKIVSPLDRM